MPLILTLSVLLLAASTTAATAERQIAVDGKGPAAPSTIVSLTFDDGIVSQWTSARGLLLSHRLNGTFFLNSRAIGLPDRMTWQQIDQLAADGNEIGGHTLDHADLLKLSADDVLFQVCGDRSALLRHGYRVRSFAYPYGSYDSAVERTVADCGYYSARWTQGLRGSAPWCASNCPYAESIPPKDRYAVRAAGSVGPAWSLGRLEQTVTRAEQNGGGWVVLTFHDICTTSCGEYSIPEPDFAAFLDWLAPRAGRGTVVRTMGQVIGTPLTDAHYSALLRAAGSKSARARAAVEAAVRQGKPAARVRSLLLAWARTEASLGKSFGSITAPAAAAQANALLAQGRVLFGSQLTAAASRLPQSPSAIGPYLEKKLARATGAHTIDSALEVLRKAGYA